MDDFELRRRIQVFCAWCGPAFAVLLFGGWGFMGGFIPLISAADSPAPSLRLSPGSGTSS